MESPGGFGYFSDCQKVLKRKAFGVLNIAEKVVDLSHGIK